MRIVVAMSGGVDSAATAGLLAASGHEVVGVTLQLYESGPRRPRCLLRRRRHPRRPPRRGPSRHPALRDRCARSGSAPPCIEDFAASYARGETPVPCVRCNQSVKFTDLFSLARDLGAERAGDRTLRAPRRWFRGARAPSRTLTPRATRAGSSSRITRAQLAFCRFPLGDMPDKAFVRAEAARLGLPVAEKPDSQDICFVPGRRLCRGGRAAAPRCAGARRDRRPPTAASSVATTASPAIPWGRASASGAPASPGASARSWWRSMRSAGASSSGRARTGTRNVALAEVNWLIAPPAPSALLGEAPRARGAAARDPVRGPGRSAARRTGLAGAGAGLRLL